MTCPQCRLYVEDGATTCPSCGSVIQTAPPTTSPEVIPRLRNSTRWLWLLAIGMGVVIGGLLLGRKSGSRAYNATTPGEPINLAAIIPQGKITIVDFYSDACPPCRRIAPALKELAKKRRDIRIIKLDINRPGVSGIDWGSPLARQFGLQSIPHFKLFDTSGQLKLEGTSASAAVWQLLQREGIEI